MDWDVAVEKNLEALKRIVAALVAMAGFDAAFTSSLQGGQRAASGGVSRSRGKTESAFTLPRRLYRTVLNLLKSAEAATRRLIIVAARGLVVTLPPPRKAGPKPVEPVLRRLGIAVVMSSADIARAAAAKRAAAARAARPRVLSLPLVDPLMRYHLRPYTAPDRATPRIWSVGMARSPLLPPPNGPINATRLGLRLAALARALDDLPGQARRFARWKARRDAGLVHRISPLKPGSAPGLPRPGSRRRTPHHEVHDVLNNLHGLAFDVLARRDTS